MVIKRFYSSFRSAVTPFPGLPQLAPLTKNLVGEVTHAVDGDHGKLARRQPKGIRVESLEELHNELILEAAPARRHSRRHTSSGWIVLSRRLAIEMMRLERTSCQCWQGHAWIRFRSKFLFGSQEFLSQLPECRNALHRITSACPLTKNRLLCDFPYAEASSGSFSGPPVTLLLNPWRPGA